MIREDALACLSAAIAAVDPERRVREALPPLRGEVTVAAFGKAAVKMARGAAANDGVLAAPRPEPVGRLRLYAGGHPFPNEASVRAARDVLDTALRLGEGETLLCLISGGGSSLLALPPEGVSVKDVADTTRDLMRAGATIHELNSVRKHLDRLKGGRLARAAFPARVVALFLSDVPGDDPAVIASGPLSPDPTTYADARAILESRGVTPPPSVAEWLLREEDESPKDPFPHVTTRVVGSNRDACRAAAEEARRRGYRAFVSKRPWTGEARDAGRRLGAIARALKPGCAFVAGGETTVTVRGRGRGGRCQELALGAALALDGCRGRLVLAAGTDGVDGPTDAAGAVAGGWTVRRSRLDPRRAVAENDAYAFFDALGDLVKTGPTGTNVMDVMLAFSQPNGLSCGS